LFSFNDMERDPANTFPDQAVFLEYMAERGGPFDGRLMIPGSGVNSNQAALRSPILFQRMRSRRSLRIS
jgi:hypothetical protein